MRMFTSNISPPFQEMIIVFLAFKFFSDETNLCLLTCDCHLCAHSVVRAILLYKVGLVQKSLEEHSRPPHHTEQLLNCITLLDIKLDHNILRDCVNRLVNLSRHAPVQGLSEP